MTAARTIQAPVAVAGARPAGLSRAWRPGTPCDVGPILAPLIRGPRDPAHWVEPGGAFWLACRAPTGPGTLRVTAVSALGEVGAQAWGPGAEWLLDGLPELLGANDDPAGFAPAHALVRESVRRHRGWRVPRTRRVLDALVPAILEQKVSTIEAFRSWRELLTRFGTPAPGPLPVPLRVSPTPREWAMIPSWEWHRAGVDAKRSRAVVTAARVARRLQETVDLEPGDARRRLVAVPGVGHWTASEVMQRAHGDADALSVGDLHIPRIVGCALGDGPTDDAGMLELLEPYRGHRYRAFRYIELSGIRELRRAPRAALKNYRRL